MQKNNVPIIIVYTMSEDQDNMEKMERQVKDNFYNIPYVEVLSKDSQEIESFGLDKLINTTVEQCKYAFESKTFDEMKEEINQTITKNLKNNNSDIKYSVNKESILYFINNFDKEILGKNQFKKYIFYLFTILFNGYFKKENESKISEQLYEVIMREFNNSNISEYINEIIDCYDKISSQFIDKIKEEKAIEFLDKQAIHEKNNSNLEIQNKCNKNDFIKIIESFLKNNFSFFAQKYFIYQYFIPIIEAFSEKIENEVNVNLFSIILNNPQIKQKLKNIYTKKVEDLSVIIKEFLEKEGYHKINNNVEKKCNIIRKENKLDAVNVDEIESLKLEKGIENLYSKED